MCDCPEAEGGAGNLGEDYDSSWCAVNQGKGSMEAAGGNWAGMFYTCKSKVVDSP